MLPSKIQDVLLAPSDTETAPESLGVNDIIDLLGEGDSDEKDEKVVTDTEGADLLADKSDKSAKDSDEDGDKEDDEKELELSEDKEPDDEDLELTSLVSRKEILKKYPTLFKEFPSLEKAYYRERAYTEIFPTIDDAKEAIEASKTLKDFGDSLFSGDTEKILQAVKEQDKDAFGRIVDGYLDTLGKVDRDAYYNVISNIGKRTIIGMVREADRTSNENLKAAAVVLNQFLFGTSEFQPPANFGPADKKDATESDKIKAERAELVQEKFNSTQEDLSTRTDNIVKSTISQHIDPKGQMTDYVKKTAIKDAMEQVEELINSDTRFKKSLDKLWEKAFQSNFSRNSVKDIERAYLSKARTLLPAAIQKSRNEALKGLGKRVTDSREEPKRRGLVPPGRTATPNSSNRTESGSKNAVPKGMKTLDYLMSED